ncbi:MAG TPA: beta-glucosidase [Rhizomicrobium sp.]|nr:beta-glucosidase [Rhizomicrobium sp.]
MRHRILQPVFFAIAFGSVWAASAMAQTNPWMNKSLAPDARAAALLRVLTLDEKLALLHGHAPLQMRRPPPDALLTSGYVAGIPRFDIPPLQETDAGLGVTNPLVRRRDAGSTVLPSGLAQAATWNPTLAREGGAVIGAEAHAKGFNVVLAGGLDLEREPRGGRNFEYAGEDPFLAGTMVGYEVQGIQGANVISTLKHYAFNDQETGRFIMDVSVDPAAARESDLLAFELAIETGHPGSIMCAYNRFGGIYACENDDLLNGVLKGEWRYPGFVMSDWGATHSTEKAALGGLDQEDGEEFDGRSYFAAALANAVTAGRVPQSRLDDMALRVLTAMFANGVIDHPPAQEPIDFELHADVTQRVAEQSITLLKNADGILPLKTSLRHIAVIGGHADVGTLGGGGGSSEVAPHCGARLRLRHPEADFEVYETYICSAPSETIAANLPGATVTYEDGSDLAKAAEAARSADVAIVFATQWTSESIDAPTLALPLDQDGLIEAVAAANPHTVVVLETGGPVLMPWLDHVEGVVEAWYPGSRGGEAIARILCGAVDPSGRLPVTFPMNEAQLPRPELPGYAAMLETRGTTRNPHAPPPPFTVHYFEGAEVGYRWNEVHKLTPLFPFGFGLSYATFRYSNLNVQGGKSLAVTYDVTNTGTRAGFDTSEVYSAKEYPGRTGIRRLVGWSKLYLNPGETGHVSVTADGRLLAHFNTDRHIWDVEGGAYQLTVGRFAGDEALLGEADMLAAHYPP